jgi:photosystem II stability/assembly factor-like uncharacterized protein
VSSGDVKTALVSLRIALATAAFLFTAAAGAQNGLTRPLSTRAAGWRLTSTALFDVRVSAIALDPRSSSTIYVGGHTGPIRQSVALFRSDDAGLSWRRIQSGLSGLTVTGLLVDPANLDVVYVGIFGGGLFKSSDRGDSWSRLTSGLLPWVNALAVDPRALDTLYCTIGGGGLYKTMDGGMTWAQVGGSLPASGQLVSSLAFGPGPPGRLYATTEGSLYRSDDGGASWQLLSSGVGKLLSIAPTSPILFAQASADGGLLRSTDAGMTWTPIEAGLPPRGLGDSNNGVVAVAFDPSNSEILYAGTAGAGVFRSTSGGTTWTPVSDGLVDLHVHALAIPPEGGFPVYAGTESGLFDLRSRGDFQVTLPAVASLHGVPPTFFHSDVWVFNGSADSEATVTATYRCLSGSPCTGPPQTFTIPARQVKSFRDVAVSLFNAPESAGAVEFESDRQIIATSRLYTPDASEPTTGMFVPGRKPEQAANRQVLTLLSHSADPATGFRTNVGFYNGTDSATFVTLAFFEGSGASLGEILLFGPPRQPLQLNDAEIFQRLGISRDVPNFYCVVSASRGETPIHTYAAVIDNRSLDPIFVPGQDAAAMPESKITLPAAASLRGARSTFFHSDARVWNASETAFATVTARYVCFTGSCSDAEQSFLVAPRRMLVLDDVVTSLFHAPDTGGVIEFVSQQPLVVTSRLYTPAPSEPTVGMFVPGLPPSRASPALVLNGLSHPADVSSGSRVNVGVFNQADVPQVITYRFFGGGGEQIGQMSRLFAARESFQVNDVFAFLNVSTPVESAYCLIEGSELLPLFAYAAIVDNRSQDPIFIPGEDDPEKPPIVPFAPK